MSLKLPPVENPARELIDLEQIASLGDPANRLKLPGLPAAIRAARDTFASDPAVQRVNVLVCRANGTLELISFGPNGGRKLMWNFGQLAGIRG